MRLQFIILCLIFTSVLSCNESSAPRDELINKFDKISIEGFEGFGIYRRGKDDAGNKLIYISKTLDTEVFQNSGNIVVAIDSNSYIKYIDSKADSFNLNIDTIKRIATIFNSLNITSLSLDYEGKAYMSLNFTEQAQIMKSPKNKNYQGWERIKDNWYRRSE